MDETLRVNLQTRRRIVDGERLAAQPQGYYVHNTAYPEDGDKIVGTVARELRESTLTTAPAPSSFCLQRPNPLVPSADHHVHLDCNGNGACKLHFPSPKWLEICAVESPRTSMGFSLFPQAFAADEARKWSVPSAKTLAAHEGQLKGVGYTLIDIQTDVFQDPAVIGVEVDVRVNGTSILEDGLAPGQRPVPNDPAQALPPHLRAGVAGLPGRAGRLRGHHADAASAPGRRQGPGHGADGDAGLRGPARQGARRPFRSARAR